MSLKLEKIAAEREKARRKRDEWEERRKEWDRKYHEQENSEICEMVHTKIQNCVWDVRRFILLTNLVID